MLMMRQAQQNPAGSCTAELVLQLMNSTHIYQGSRNHFNQQAWGGIVSIVISDVQLESAFSWVAKISVDPYLTQVADR